MPRHCLVSLLAAMVAVGPLGPAAWAQDGPGVPAVAFAQSELFTPLYTFASSQIGSRPTFAGMHRGYLIVAGGGVGSQPRALTLWGIDDPTSPTLFSSTPDISLFKTHAMGFSGDLVTVRAGAGAIYDIADPASPVRRGTMGGVASSLWTFYAAPYIYKGGEGYDAASGWVSILDASDPDNIIVVNEIDLPALVGFRCGSTHVLGNLLVVSASQTNGVVTFDLSDPQNPVLQDVLRVPGDQTYTSLLSGNRLYSGGQDGGLHVYDLTDPSNIVHVGSVRPGGSARYPMLQDEFIHLGNLGIDHYQKIDIDRLQLVASIALPDGEPEIALPLGNLVFVGNSQEDNVLPGGYLIAHDRQPDTRGIVVSAVRPTDGETGVAITSMIGIALTDQIDPRTVNATTVTVRPLGGAALAGTYTTQTGTINFIPDAPLAPDTTYEVVVPTGGVRDVASNGVVIASVTRFATGASVVATPPAAPSDVIAVADGSARINLSWTANGSSQDNYLIERQTATGPFLPLAEAAASSTGFTDTAVTPFTVYRYRVRAQGDGNSPFSNQAAATTLGAGTNSDREAHWRFDGDTLDAAGNGHTATLMGDATFTPDAAVGSDAVALDGAQDWVATDDFNLGAEFSLSMWAYVDAAHSNIQTFAANTVGGAPANGFRFFVNEYNTTNASLRFETQLGALGDVAASPAGTFAFDQWNHVAVTVNRTVGAVRIYYNGADVTIDSTARQDFSTDGPLELGRMFGNFALNGRIDDVRIYKRFLTPFDVSILADPAPPGPPAALIATAPSATAIDLAWSDGSNNEAEFQIERATAAGPFVQIAVVAPNTVSFQDPGLAAATLYRYRVRAANHNGASAYTNEAVATTSAGTSAPGLAAHWPLDNNAIDITGNGHDGALAGGATFSSAAMIGSHALALDGVDGYLDAGPFDLAQRFTIATWIRVDSGSFNIQTVAANSGGGFISDGFRFFVNAYETADGSVRLESGNGIEGNFATSPAGVFAFDQWNHVAAVVDRPAGTVRLYYNGSDVTADTSVLSDFNLSGPLRFGEMLGTGFALDGGLDDARIYARALSAAEIAGLATPGSGGTLSVQAAPTAPAIVATAVTFDVTAVGGGAGVLEYSWDFNDGTAPTPFLTAPAVEHVFAAPGHFTVQVTARDQQGQQAVDSDLQTIHRPLSAGRPVSSSTIQYDAARQRVWTVNPDNDTITAVDASMLTKIAEFDVGDHPRTLALTADGAVWVTNQDDASISVLAGDDGSLIRTVELPYGSAPYAVAAAPYGNAMYVSLQGAGELLELSALTGEILRSVDVGTAPRGIAVSEDGQRIFVTRFLSAQTAGNVTEVDAATFSVTTVIPLANDPGPDSPNSGRGVPNYLSTIAVSPDGTRAWVPSMKHNTDRGGFRDGQPLTFESTARTIVSKIDLAASAERIEERVDLDNSNLAFAAQFSPLGDWVFVALTGNNLIDVRDAYSGSSVTGLPTGFAPQGVALAPDGSLLFTHDFLQRSVSVFDVYELSSGTGVGAYALTSIATVDNEALDPQVLSGKRIFYNAADTRMSLDGYLSCASCHLDGGQDGRVWDFTDRGEGLRNTIDLRGRAGTGHGNVHWTANFDEIQDFENDVRGPFGGSGFLSDAQFALTSDPLGAPKSGLSADLDALTAYVTSLTNVPDSPHRASDGSLTPAAVAGRVVFFTRGCSACHTGSTFRDGLRHDIGTVQASSGTGAGAPLAGVGFDTPTLRGLWSAAPYLHNGQADTLDEVLLQTGHGSAGQLNATDRAALVEYLLQIDQPQSLGQPVCGAGQPQSEDCDNDGLANSDDNCVHVGNPAQSDTDLDGIGNACDSDVAVPNDCVVNVLDLGVYRQNFFQVGDLATDNNNDGVTNALDLAILRGLYLRPVGVSGAPNLCAD